MQEERRLAPAATAESRTRAYEPPRFEWISLDCEITAYAPDGDDPPLF